jgi:cardiolipin synthase
MDRIATGEKYLHPDLTAPVPGNSAELLCDGDGVLPRMLQAIESARSFLAIEMYRFVSDAVGNRFARALGDASRRGIEVRVLVDSAGCRDTPRSFFGWMRSHGIEVRGVNPLRRFLRRSAASGWRDHRKLLISDGEAAFVGGLNLCRDAAPRNEGGGGWHDAAVRLRGPVVAGVLRSFDHAWSLESRIRRTPRRPIAIPDRAGETPALILESQALGPGPFGRALRFAIRRAERRVWIATPYFLPPRSLRRELAMAARRGVDVRILVPGRSDCPFVLWASQRSYASLLRSGIRIFEWGPSMMHAKVAVVDGLWSTIGSYNLDPLSFFRNRELNVALLGAGTGGCFERMLERDFSRSTELEAGRWGLRSALRRVAERVCAGFRSML